MVSVRYSAAKERDMPLFRTLQWSWFVVAMVYTYGDFLHEFVLHHRALLWLSHITMFNAWLSFIAYCCVFIVSVLTLKKGLYRYQACPIINMEVNVDHCYTSRFVPTACSKNGADYAGGILSCPCCHVLRKCLIEQPT